jgi:hypothetical protein
MKPAPPVIKIVVARAKIKLESHDEASKQEASVPL